MHTPDSMLPTIEDVAQAAGVSTATVSRVLNKPDTVREELRQRVLDAVARLGYVPHAGARALMLRRSGTVGAVFPTVDHGIFSRAIEALQRRLGRAGLQLLLATHGYSPEVEEEQVMNLVAHGADALVLCGNLQRPRLLQFLRQRGLPTVHVMSWPAVPDTLCVGFDNARAVGRVVDYLVGMGHRRIAMLAGVARDNDRAAARVSGMRAALAAHGLALAPGHLVERPYGLAEGREGLRALMSTSPRPTAIVCGNDVLAVGALLEAQELGIAIPRDLSVVGFDDLELARHIQPALTTVHVPTQEMWECAAERLIAALQQQPCPAATEFKVELVVRGSSGPAPAG